MAPSVPSSRRQRRRFPPGPGRRVGGARAALALQAALAAGRLSRALELGSGSVIGGRVALVIEPRLVELLSSQRQVALVTGTNGKTTTTRLLAAALAARDEDGGGDRAHPGVAWSEAGANMPAGIVAALAGAPRGAPAVLEVDEAYLALLVAATRPAAVVLLNLSRDQLDRVSEVRMLAARWAAALTAYEGAVVANADDPLVVWAAGQAPHVLFVGAGQRWHEDAHHCPACDAGVEFDPAGWRCPGCELRRPDTVAELTDAGLALRDGPVLPLRLALPGRFNRANAALAVVAADAMGVPPALAAAALGHVGEVAGRFATVRAGGLPARLMLAKNPAGWSELVELLASGTAPLVAAINARLADGRDPSWLWDVPFEQLAGRLVVATGDRRLDLAVRLLHAGAAHEVAADPLEAVARAARPGGGSVDVVGNYTAFQDLRRLSTPAAPAAGAGAGAGPAAGAGPGGLGRRLAGIARAAQRLAPLAARPSPRGAWRAGRGDVPATTKAEARPARPVVRPVVRPTTAGDPGGRRAGARESALRVVVVHPDLLGTYGDAGNGRVLANRALWRGLEVELVLAASGRALPETGDCYVLGGGEDGPQLRSAELLRAGALSRAVERGATVLAVCAGFQIAGTSLPGPAGEPVAGLGLLDAVTARTTRPRAVGEVLARPLGALPTLAGSELLTGFENHASLTTLGAGAAPLAEVLGGTGNDAGGTEGAVTGRIVGTYLHGPVLARNPALADALLRLATGEALVELDESDEAALRSERLRAAWAAGGSRRGKSPVGRRTGS